MHNKSTSHFDHPEGKVGRLKRCFGVDIRNPRKISHYRVCGARTLSIELWACPPFRVFVSHSNSLVTCCRNGWFLREDPSIDSTRKAEVNVQHILFYCVKAVMMAVLAHLQALSSSANRTAIT